MTPFSFFFFLQEEREQQINEIIVVVTEKIISYLFDVSSETIEWPSKAGKKKIRFPSRKNIYLQY